MWEQRRELDPLLKDNETRDLTVCPRCYVKLDAFFVYALYQLSYSAEVSPSRWESNP